jgi:5-methylthioribose kinase
MNKTEPDRHQLIAFAKNHLSDIDDTSPPEALPGGNLNFVWRIQRAAGNSAIIKYAPPYVATKPDIFLDDSRIVFEGRVLEAFRSRLELKALTEMHVQPPEFIALDARRHLLLMEDVGALPDLHGAFQNSEFNFEFLAGQLGKFIAHLHGQTHQCSWFAQNFANLPVQQTRLQIQYRVCYEFGRKAGFSEAEEIGNRCRHLGEKFNSVGKCLIMGDLWPASILVDHDRLRLIDWELTHFGRPPQDVAHLSAHLWMMTHRSNDALEKNRIRRFQHTFLRSYYDTLENYNPDLFTGEDEHDFQIHFGAEILARTVGEFQNDYLYDGLGPDHPIVRKAVEEAKRRIFNEKHVSDLR